MDSFLRLIGTYPNFVFEREIALNALSIAKKIHVICEEEWSKECAFMLERNTSFVETDIK